ncbi:MAG: tryptophan synthase subunit alpha [Pseudomonadales bacterium]|nr:tryptophan synthase subunit alpha [Pseudomonadales bacterium]
MTRIQRLFENLGERRALVTFVTAGDPTIDHTVAAMHALVAGGADLLELGIPFSDPEAEGPAIQVSSERALANGMTLAKTLDMVAEFRQTDADTPVVLMGYLNSVLAMDDFANRAQTTGVDGLIMVNLPPEESAELRSELAQHKIDLIFLLAPTTTNERAQFILNNASGFAYYVSLKGITGANNLNVDEVAKRMASLKSMSDVPVCVGFGIKDPETAAAVGAHADGVVVGSALVNLMAAHADDVEQSSAALRSIVADLRAGLDRA